MISIYWLPLFAMLGALVFLGLRRLRGTPQLTIVEAKTFLRHAGSEEFLRDLNPDIEDVLRNNFSRRHFMELQRDALHRMKERVLCMSHDALICIHLANNEIWRETKDGPRTERAERYRALGRELHRSAVEFRFFTLMTLVRIEFWLALRTKWWVPLPAPNLPDLRGVGGITFYPCYQRFRSAMGALCLEYGQEFYDEIVPLL